jgi:Uma2 family endonuclease
MLVPTTMTAEEFLALPRKEGVDRWLIRGELREKPMAYRNRYHSRSTARATSELDQWVEAQPEPRGQVLNGDAGFRLPGDPPTLVGIDVAYVSAATLANTFANSTVVTGAPTLAVEVLSPSDTKEEIDEKIDAYLEAGTAVVWILDTHFRTVTAHAPGVPPRFFAAHDLIDAEPHLPGFRVPASRFFD